MINAAKFKELLKEAQQAAEAFEEHGKPDDYHAAVRNGNKLKDFLLCYAEDFLGIVDANQWRDISEAPRHGTVIWAVDIKRNYAAAVRCNAGEWECVSYNGSDIGIGFSPTHWVHLPNHLVIS